MPELPEVETIKNDLEKLIAGREILEIKVEKENKGKSPVKPSLKKIRDAVVGKTIKKIKRRAKLLQIFVGDYVLAIHLKMTGRLLVRNKKDKKDKWQRVVFSLSKNKELRFADARKFGWVKLMSQEELKKELKKYGPEPLADLTLEKFKEIVSQTSQAIKKAIMDQKKISGIGNIYASEALFLAKIDPRRPANKLSAKENEKLFHSIEKVLKKGLEMRGASDQYYVDAKGEKGSYQDEFLVYSRQGENCPNNCLGKIKRIVVGGRGTFFCPKCQK